MTDVKGLIERLRETAEQAARETHTFERCSARAGAELTALAIEAATALEQMQRERDEALGTLAEALEIRAGFLAAADSEDWQEETQSSVVIMRDTASKLRALSPKEAAE